MGDIGGAAQAGANVVDTQATNRTNLEIAGEQMAFNSAQAALNRQFQDTEMTKAENYDTQMANTQMQRRVADLTKAGINPLLAAGSLGGAASPTIGQPSGATASYNSGPLVKSEGISGAAQAIADLKQTNAQTAAIQTGTRKTGMEADLLEVQTTPDMLMKYSQSLENQYAMTADQAGVVAQTRALLLSQTALTDANRMNVDTARAGQIISNNIASMDEQQKAALLDQVIKTQSAVLSQQKSEAINISMWQDPNSIIGKTIGLLQAGGQHLNQSAQGAASTIDAARKMGGVVEYGLLP